jgi:hypothetical protein
VRGEETPGARDLPHLFSVTSPSGTDFSAPDPGRLRSHLHACTLHDRPAMSTSGLKQIAPVPTAADFLDIVLSKTQRKTPTVRPRPAQSMLRV